MTGTVRACRSARASTARSSSPISAPVGLWKSGISRRGRGCRGPHRAGRLGDVPAVGVHGQRHQPGAAAPQRRRWCSGRPGSRRRPGRRGRARARSTIADAGHRARRHEHLVGAGRQAALGVAVGDHLAQLGHPEGEVAGAGEVAGQLADRPLVGLDHAGRCPGRGAGEVDDALAGVRREQRAARCAAGCRTGRVGDRPGAAAGGEVAAVAQHGIRAGDGGAADVEGGGELALARQPGAGRRSARRRRRGAGRRRGRGRPGARPPACRRAGRCGRRRRSGVDMVATLSGLAIEVQGHFRGRMVAHDPDPGAPPRRVPPRRARADEPDRAAARRPARAPGDPAAGRAGALRHLDGAAAARRPRARAVGRAAVRPDPAHPDVVRRDEHRRVVRRAAALDPAAPVARARHGAQRRRHRGGHRRDARGRARPSRAWAGGSP